RCCEACHSRLDPQGGSTAEPYSEVAFVCHDHGQTEAPGFQNCHREPLAEARQDERCGRAKDPLLRVPEGRSEKPYTVCDPQVSDSGHQVGLISAVTPPGDCEAPSRFCSQRNARPSLDERLKSLLRVNAAEEQENSLRRRQFLGSPKLGQ